MQMLRCTRDTVLLPSDDNHQDHALHHRDDGHHPPEPTNDTRCGLPEAAYGRKSPGEAPGEGQPTQLLSTASG
uniref:hypothetical protein n=1 Tax=Streptomyces sp. NBC_01562 TaxID=2975879 RepID=UPI002F916D86